MKSFDQLLRVMEKLRSPKGCPWDRKQTHSSLVRYLFEEAHEVKKAIQKRDYQNLEEELGDILLQVIFHAQLAKEKNRFSINGVIRELTRKLTLRHPHVFGYQPIHQKILGKKKLLTEKDVLANWALLKRISKKTKKSRKGEGIPSGKSI